MRIIAGRLRGRDLGSVPRGVRPTTDRVRESLFSSLGSLEDCAVLDLFAGTGALGLESFSRGARQVVFVERSKRVSRSLKKSLAALDLDGELAAGEEIRLLEEEALRAIRRLEAEGNQSFDLVFVDPPYQEGKSESAREPAVEAIFASGLLNPQATVVVEGPTRHPLSPLPGVRVVDERRYGDTTLTWLARPAAAQE